jgi:hypothetical protein
MEEEDVSKNLVMRKMDHPGARLGKMALSLRCYQRFERPTLNKFPEGAEGSSHNSSSWSL